MAAGDPTYGGSNGVSPLDIGQPGGTNDTNGLIHFVGIKVLVGVTREKTVDHDTAQLTSKFQDNLGFAGSVILWRGLLKASTKTQMRKTLNELDSLLHGQLRDENTGLLGPVDVTRLRATQLSDSDGTMLTTRARIGQWRALTELTKAAGGEWIMRVEIPFKVLG